MNIIILPPVFGNTSKIFSYIFFSSFRNRPRQEHEEDDLDLEDQESIEDDDFYLEDSDDPEFDDYNEEYGIFYYMLLITTKKHFI